MNTEIPEFIGKTLASIEHLDRTDEITFNFNNGESYKMEHFQDCCESVTVEDIAGDFEDLIGKPLLVAEERTSNDYGEAYESATWTFYEFATIKGNVTIRWCGESNGYYSESVDIYKVKT